MTNGIKIACDFMSIENLDATVQVRKTLHKHHLSQGDAKGDDVLQLYLTLWYAWKHLDIPPPKIKSAGFAYICPLSSEHKFDTCNGILDHL